MYDGVVHHFYSRLVLMLVLAVFTWRQGSDLTRSRFEEKGEGNADDVFWNW